MKRYKSILRETDIISQLKPNDKIIINFTQNEEKFGIKHDKKEEEIVVIGKGFSTGAIKDKDFITLHRKAGAPYTITFFKLKKIFVKKL